MDVDELARHVAALGDLDELRRITLDLRETIGPDGGSIPNAFPRLCTALGLKPIGDIQTLIRFGHHCSELMTMLAILKEHYGTLHPLEALGDLADNKIESLRTLRADIVALNAEFLGSLKWWRKSAINNRYRSLFPDSKLAEAYGSLPVINSALEIIGAAELRKDSMPTAGQPYDFAANLMRMVRDEDICREMLHISRFADDLRYLEERIKIYPVTLKKLGIKDVSLSSLCHSKLAVMFQDEFDDLVAYLALHQRLEQNFQAHSIGFSTRKRQIEELITMEMTFCLDGRVIDFYQNNLATAKSLRTIIQKKRRFPKDEFKKLKGAFPCILAGIRDYAEYIPLHADIFDLVIIDEASQVSIAQAFPALLRARKVLVLGDKKQFSNVKAAHARSETNNEYVNRLRARFLDCVSSDEAKLTRIENFNIRTSILEFFEYINNFTIQLNKYFRGLRWPGKVRQPEG